MMAIFDNLSLTFLATTESILGAAFRGAVDGSIRAERLIPKQSPMTGEGEALASALGIHQLAGDARRCLNLRSGS
jgi:hypothetical protein